MDAKIEHGDVLVVATLDRIGRRSPDVTGKIYELVNRGVRLCSLTVNEAGAKGLDAKLKSLKWMAAVLIAQVCSFSAQLDWTLRILSSISEGICNTMVQSGGEFLYIGVGGR